MYFISIALFILVCGSTDISRRGRRPAVSPQGAADRAEHAAGAVQGPEGDRRQPGGRGSRRSRENRRRN